MENVSANLPSASIIFWSEHEIASISRNMNPAWRSDRQKYKAMCLKPQYFSETKYSSENEIYRKFLTMKSS